MSPHRSGWQRALVISAGWAFVVLGLIGLVLPFLQGILFLAIGFGILSREHHWAARLMDRLRRRYPGVAAKLEEGERRLARLAERLRAWLKR